MDGTVIAIADGESTITAELDGLTATATVKVLSGYYPEPHIGWAGSNIYYDAALGYLTFDDVSDTSHENYSGVYFAPGSLLAYSFEIIPSIDLYTFPIAGGTQLYENHGAATLEELCNTMFLHDKKNITDWDRGYLTEAYHAKTNIGDVCHHLTSMGWSPPGYWTLPTANEIAQWVHDEEIVTAPAPNITNRYGTNRTSYYTATPINKPSSIMSRNGTEWLSGTYLSSSIQDGYPLISNDNFVYPAVGNTITTIRCVKRKE